MNDSIVRGSAPVCPQCGKLLSERAKFCHACGRQLPANAGFCRICGRQLPANARFCHICGTAVAVPGQTPRVTPSEALHANPAAVSKRRFRPVPVIAGVLVFAILLGIFVNRDRLFDRTARQTSHTTSSSGPSGSKAIDISPVKGLRIIAAENAMDKDRTFTAEPITDDASLLNFPGEIPGLMPMTGFSIDAGMGEGEIFPGEVEIRIDLVNLEIPREIWGDLGILRIDGTTWTSLSTDLVNHELICSTRKNSVFWVVFSLGVMAWLDTTRYQNDMTEKFNYLGDACVRDRYLDYNIYWPVTMEPANKAGAEALASELRAIKERHKVLSGQELRADYLSRSAGGNYYSAINEHYHRLQNMYRDPDYIRIKTFCTPEWRRDNLYPERVKIAVLALERADSYLFPVRRLRKPDHLVDILMLSEWPYHFSQDELAISTGNAFQDAFIMVNLSDNIFAGYTAQQSQSGKTLDALFELSNKQDELNITMVHELFHVIQEEYFTVRMDKEIRPLNMQKYMWFLEATAITLSAEANDYYVGKGWNRRPDILEDRDYWETFSNPLNDTTGDEMILRRHGYTASLLLDFLRDDTTFNHNSKEDYIRNVMEAFSGMSANSISALYTGGGSAEDDLVKAFAAFVDRQAEAMYQKIAAKADTAASDPLLADVFQPLDAQHPLYVWRVSSIKPLSAEFRILTMKNLASESLDKAFIYLVNGRHSSLEGFNLYHNIRLQDGNWGTMNDGLQCLTAARLEQLAVQRVDLNPRPVSLDLSGKTFIPADMTFKILLMLQNEAPTVTMKDQEIEVTINNNTLKDILSRQDIPIPLTYTITVNVPSEDEPFVFNLEEGESKTTISIDPKTKIGTAVQDAMNEGRAELEITYRENVKLPEQENLLTGPESKIAKIRADSTVKWVGAWIRTSYEDSIVITNPLALVDNPDLQKKVAEGKGKVIVTSTVTISDYQKDGYTYWIEWHEKRNDTYLGNHSEKTTTYLAKPGEISNALGAVKYVNGQVMTGYDDWEAIYLLDDQTILFRDYEHKR